MPANMDDFLGEGLADQGTNVLTQEQLEARDYRRRVLRDNQLNSLSGSEYAGFGNQPSPDDTVGYTTDSNGNRITIRRGGDAETADYNSRLGTVTSAGFEDGAEQLVFTPPPQVHTLLDEETPGDEIVADSLARSDEGRIKRDNALQGLIDRFDEARDSFDTTQQDQSRQAQRQALGQNQQIFQQANSFDRDAAAKRSGDEALAASLAIARSAPGGASRASALMNALQAQPAIQAEAQRDANAEGRQQQNIALQASAQLGQIAGQTRGQDEAQAEAFTGIGLDVAKSIANATGQNLDLDQRDREFLGEVALAAANLDLDIERLGVDEALRQLELQLAKEGLAQEYKIFKQSQKITGKDILGGIFGLGGSAISGFFSGKAAGR